MQNKLLQAIFPDSATATSDSSFGLSAPNSNTDAIAKAFSQLTIPQGGSGEDGGSAGLGGTNSEAGLRIPELFSDVSKNLDRLRAVTEIQAKQTESNTAALSTNTATKAVNQVLASAGQAASGFLGGLTALPLISGIVKLFSGSGGQEQPPALSKYSAPSAISFDEAVRSGSAGGDTQAASYDRFGNPRINLSDTNRVPDYGPLLANTRSAAGGTGETPETSGARIDNPDEQTSAVRKPATTNVTVNIQAMDSQSFMDRSHDIAQAVREAMLNLHSINDVVNDL